MLIFQEQPVFEAENTPEYLTGLTIDQLLGVSQERIVEISALVTKAVATASKEDKGIVAFHLPTMLASAEGTVHSPAELLFAGMCLGRAYAEHQEKQRRSAIAAKLFGGLTEQLFEQAIKTQAQTSQQ